MTTPALTVGIDASFRLYGGSETHLRALLLAWRAPSTPHRFILFSAPANDVVLRDLAGGPVELRRLAGLPASRALRLIWFQTALPRIVASAAPDVMLYPGGYVPMRRSAVPSLVIFRNAAPFCESVTLRRVGWRQTFAFRALGWLMRASAARAERAIFPSAYLRDIFVRRFGMDPARSTVLYHGRDASEPESTGPDVVARHGIRRPFALYVSHLYRYKNAVELVRAVALAREILARRRLRLVIAGGAPDAAYHGQLVALVHGLRLNDVVVLTGSVPSGEVATLIRGSDFCVFPSTCENCPNALIEALVAGKAVAASDRSAMPEICGDAALYFDPDDPAAIAAALGRLAAEDALKAELEARARRRAERFPTWPQVADRTLAELERTARAT